MTIAFKSIVLILAKLFLGYGANILAGPYYYLFVNRHHFFEEKAHI